MSTLCIVWDELNIPVKLKVYSSWTYELSSYKSYIFVCGSIRGPKGFQENSPGERICRPKHCTLSGLSCLKLQGLGFSL